jgi:hypothetical protein
MLTVQKDSYAMKEQPTNSFHQLLMELYSVQAMLQEQVAGIFATIRMEYKERAIQ